MKKTSLGGRPEWYSRYRRSQSPSFTLRPKHRGQDLSIPQQARECWSRGGPRCDHPPPSDHPDLPPRQCRAGPRIARSPKQELLPAPSSPRTLLLVLQLLLQAHQGRGSISRARSSSCQHQRTKTSGGKGARGSPADKAEPTAPTEDGGAEIGGRGQGREPGAEEQRGGREGATTGDAGAAVEGGGRGGEGATSGDGGGGGGEGHQVGRERTGRGRRSSLSSSSSSPSSWCCW